jgi:hypothetical protein
MNKTIKVALCIFQTYIGGQLAQAEVETDPSVIGSREGRKAAADLANIAFAGLSPAFVKGQPIKCVEILIVDRTAPDLASSTNGNGRHG